MRVTTRKIRNDNILYNTGEECTTVLKFPADIGTNSRTMRFFSTHIVFS